MKAAVYHGRTTSGSRRCRPRARARRAPARDPCRRNRGTDVGEYLNGPVSYATNGHDVTGHHGPLIPGHEFSGRVVEVAPDVEGFELGMVVASGAGISCGECRQCLAGRTNLCVRYSTVGPAPRSARRVLCRPGVDVYRRREPRAEETAALAQPMSIGVHSFRRGCSPGEDVVVVGAGGIGAFLTYAAAASGASVTVVDLEPERLELAFRARRGEHRAGERGADAGGRRRRAPPRACGRLRGDGQRDGLPAGLRRRSSRRTPRRRRAPGRAAARRPAQRDTPRDRAHRDERARRRRRSPEALRLLACRDSDWSDVAPTVIPLSELVSDGLQPMAEGRSARIKTLVDPWAGVSRQRAER